ncbi:hypothetical protein F6X51_19605 [Methylobacterium planeticum]|uniref:Uncharacterized protein n=2 Tax=Methylobacterium planeticum TaxID=2615211 RepID=A0A6N6MK59_9HYPH|nr:hypothetical protein F6X51_19605 [Methylobacterium planeticum]
MPPLGRRPARSARFVTLSSLYERPVSDLQPDEPLPGSIEPWHAVAPVRPDTAHVRAPRFLDMAGDLVSAFVIIAGGVAAYGFLHLA